MIKNFTILFFLLFSQLVVATNVSPQKAVQIKPAQDGIVIYPNPVEDFVEVRNVKNITKIKIYSIIGEELKVFNVSSSNHKELDVSDLNQGFYLVSFLDKKDKIVKTIRMAKS